MVQRSVNLRVQFRSSGTLKIAEDDQLAGDRRSLPLIEQRSTQPGSDGHRR